MVFGQYSNPRENTAVFQLAPTHVAYANTLRRLCLTGVEMVGFRADIRDDGSTSDVKVLANSTPMTNEMLAHRIGLLPIHVSNPTEWQADDYKFVLDVNNTTDKVIDVCAGDFRVLQKRGDDWVPVPTSQFFKAWKGQTCLIAMLKPLLPGGKPEEIQLEAKATIGIGRENARFIPTTRCSYSYTLDTDEAHIKQAFEQWLQKSYKIDNISEFEKNQDKYAEKRREFQTLEIQRCYLKDEHGEPNSFDFTIETTGVLTPEYVVARALENGAKLCQRFAGESLPEDVVVQLAESRIRGHDFIFQRQDHTLGHLIQAWIDQNLIGSGEVVFAGYDVPHPLRDEMVIRIGTVDGQEQTARKALRTAMTACAQMFISWRDQWVATTRPEGFAPSAAVSAPSTTIAKRPRVIRRPGTTLQ